MGDVAAIITASVGLLGAAGAAGKFVWDKLERRFLEIEGHSLKCRQGRAIQLTVIELFWQELERVSPGSPVLTRAKHLLDDVRRIDREED